MAAVVVKDSSAVQHQVNMDVNPDGSETQVVKLQIGDTGDNEGLVSGDNPLPVQLSVFFKRLFQVFSKLRFNTASAMYVDCNSSNIGTVTTVTTCSTVTQGNMSMGDLGKNATSMITTMQCFNNGVGRNFVRS